MTNFVPILPLEIIVYPEETLVLTIQEFRYKQMIRDCQAEKKGFGIPVLQEGKALEYGTLLEILNVVEESTGVVFVQVKGLIVFRILEFIRDLPGKTYSGAIVSYPENNKMKVHPDLSGFIAKEARRLYSVLNVESNLPDEGHDWSSYEIAHRLGLTKEQEYSLLCIFNEVQRMEFLRRYFQSIFPKVDDIDQIKSRINLN